MEEKFCFHKNTNFMKTFEEQDKEVRLSRDFYGHNRRKNYNSRFIPLLLTLPPPGTCFTLSLEPHLD